MSNYFPLNLLVYLIASYIAILSAEKTAEYCGRRDDIIIPTYNALAATSFRIIFANKLIIFFLQIIEFVFTNCVFFTILSK